MILSLTFGLVWVIIIVTVYLKPFVYNGIETIHDIHNKRKQNVAKTVPVVPEDKAESIAIEKRLKEYVNMYVPSIYIEENVFKRISKQIVESHFLYDLITSTDVDDALTTKYLRALKIITHLSGMYSSSSSSSSSSSIIIIIIIIIIDDDFIFSIYVFPNPFVLRSVSCR